MFGKIAIAIFGINIFFTFVDIKNLAMEFNDIHICKIDLDEEEIRSINSSDYGEELINYLTELFGTVISESSGRQFKFESQTTEVRALISQVNTGESFAQISETIAKRLLNCEFEAQEKVNKLGKVIQKGIIVQAKISENGNRKFIICKADHNEFLDDQKFRLSKGLPVKKKAFKAFVCNLVDGNEVDGILVYDTNPTDTKYWWKEFLELTMVHSDEDNTENAFNAIDKGVLIKIKKDHPQDYTYIRNSAVRYFRSKERFEMQDFLDNAIGNYDPVDDSLNVEKLKDSIKQLSKSMRKPFDNQFNIVREKVKARFSSTIKLTDQIDLHIKEDFPENTVFAEEKNGQKYVSIRSDVGYSYFKNFNN